MGNGSTFSTRRRFTRLTAWGGIVALASTAGLATVARGEIGPGGVEFVYSPIADATTAEPPLPPTSTYPVQLVLDDDQAEGSFGVAAQASRQFLWFNRFDTGSGFLLQEVWVLFPVDAEIAVGDAVQIAIYEDDDGDPTNGALLRQSFDTTIQVVDGETFSIYPLAEPVHFSFANDALIGVVPRFVTSGVTPPTAPAALDTTASQQRSWVAIWSGDPPNPPVLPPDGPITLVESFVAGGGNWMIRGFGTELSVLEIPALGASGLAILVAVLAALGWMLLRRRTT